jgi:hypothetical protein
MTLFDISLLAIGSRQVLRGGFAQLAHDVGGNPSHRAFRLV